MFSRQNILFLLFGVLLLPEVSLATTFEYTLHNRDDRRNALVVSGGAWFKFDSFEISEEQQMRLFFNDGGTVSNPVDDTSTIEGFAIKWGNMDDEIPDGLWHLQMVYTDIITTAADPVIGPEGFPHHANGGVGVFTHVETGITLDATGKAFGGTGPSFDFHQFGGFRNQDIYGDAWLTIDLRSTEQIEMIAADFNFRADFHGTEIPEPGTLLLLGSGLLAGARTTRFRKKLSAA